MQMRLEEKLEAKKLPQESEKYEQYSYVTDNGEYVPSSAKEEYAVQTEGRPDEEKE